MSMFQRFLYWLTGYLPCRIIKGPNGEPYLERYNLLRIGEFVVYLHRFVDSDPADRGIHDHPWGWAVSVILSGGYQEIRMLRRGDSNSVVIREYKAPRVNILKGEDFHRVVLPNGQQAWSLFFHGRRVRNWGFLPEVAPGRYGDEQRDYELVPERAKSEREWWKTAPPGRFALRQPLFIPHPANPARGYRIRGE